MADKVEIRTNTLIKIRNLKNKIKSNHEINLMPYKYINTNKS